MGVKVKMNAANRNWYLHTFYLGFESEPNKIHFSSSEFFQLEASTWKEITFVTASFVPNIGPSLTTAPPPEPPHSCFRPLFGVHGFLSNSTEYSHLWLLLTTHWSSKHQLATHSRTSLVATTLYSTYHHPKVFCYPNHKRFVTESLSRASRWSYVSSKVLTIFLNSWPHGLLESCWEMLFSKG